MSTEKNGLEGIKAPVLEETTYDESKFRKKSLDDIQAPVLEDTYTADAAHSKRLDDVAAPVLEDTVYTHQSSASKVLESVAPPQLDDGGYTAPAASGSDILRQQISAPVLDSQPQNTPPPARFVDPDLERAKAEGKRLAQQQASAEPELTDEQKARRREINRQMNIARDAAMAQKGAKLVVLLAVLGVISSVCLSVFMKMDFQEGTKELFEKISDIIIYYSIALGAVSILILPRVQFLKKLGSFVFGLNTLLMLFPGSTMITSKVNTGVSVIFYAVSLLLSGYICFSLSSNENIDKYYKKREDIYG